MRASRTSRWPLLPRSTHDWLQNAPQQQQTVGYTLPSGERAILITTCVAIGIMTIWFIVPQLPPHDRRALAAHSFTQLTARYPHHARMLLWLRACWLIRREQLQAIGWPQPSTSAQQELCQQCVERFGAPHRP